MKTTTVDTDPSSLGDPSDDQVEALWDELERLLREGRPIDLTELAARHRVAIAEAEDCLAAARSLLETCAPVITTAPRRLGGYELVGEVARGGMGIVYRAWRSDLRAHFALKILSAGDRAGSEQVERLRVEARAAARVRHPNVVAVHDLGVDQGFAFLVMDLVPGESLHAKLKRLGPLEERRAAQTAHDLAQGLAAVHALGVLHRDVKPQNVLVTPDGRPMLTDFGLAKDTSAEDLGLTNTGQFMGTVGYVAPEQARGQQARVDGRADVYGLGATLYHMLAGAAPFAGLSAVDALAAAVTAPVPPISTVRPDVGRELEAICLKCLEAAPEERYASAQEFADDLRRFLEGVPVLARPAGPARRALAWARRHRAATSALLAAAVAVALSALGASGWSARSERLAHRWRAEEARRTYAPTSGAARPSTRRPGPTSAPLTRSLAAASRPSRPPRRGTASRPPLSPSVHWSRWLSRSANERLRPASGRSRRTRIVGSRPSRRPRPTRRPPAWSTSARPRRVVASTR